MLELGAGCGLPGVACAKDMGARRVILTDFWEGDDDDDDDVGVGVGVGVGVDVDVDVDADGDLSDSNLSDNDGARDLPNR